jgi:acetyl-CoA carboxylase biotin carboxyl carrier protein
VLTIKPQDVAALVEAFERSSAQDMRIAAGNFELQLSKTATGAQSWARRSSAHEAGSDAVAVAASAPAPSQLAPARSAAPKDGPAAVATERPAVSSEPPAGHVFVRAANLGTFYRSPKPGAPSYVEVGGRVYGDTEVCLIEVMKLFTPLIAGVQGVVREVYVTDGALVEFDQPLFLIEVDA